MKLNDKLDLAWRVLRARSAFLITNDSSISYVATIDHDFIRDLMKMYVDNMDKANWIANELDAGRITSEEANEQIQIEFEKPLEELRKKHGS